MHKEILEGGYTPCKSTIQLTIIQYTKTIDRNNELPVQWLRSSLLQRWHRTNICQPGKSREQGFLYLSTRQDDPQCCRVAVLGLLFFLLRIVYLSTSVSPFESLSCQLYPSQQPYLCSFTFLMSQALLYISFCSSFYQFSSFLRSLSWGYTSMQCSSWGLDHRQLNRWEEGYRYDKLFWKKAIDITLWKAVSFIVRSCCCEGAESNNTHLIK